MTPASARLQYGDVPFHDMDTLALTDADIFGLSELRTLRVYKQARFVAMVAAGVNLSCVDVPAPRVRL